MSATLTTPTRLAGPALERFARPRRLTLEERLEGIWGAMRAGAAADCPLCHAPMRPTPAGAGRCGTCGTELS